MKNYDFCALRRLYVDIQYIWNHAKIQNFAVIFPHFPALCLIFGTKKEKREGKGRVRALYLILGWKIWENPSFFIVCEWIKKREQQERHRGLLCLPCIHLRQNKTRTTLNQVEPPSSTRFSHSGSNCPKSLFGSGTVWYTLNWVVWGGM